MGDVNEEAISKVRIYLRKEGLILPKAPIREFYSQIFKLSGFGIGGILNFSGKKAGNIAAHILKEMLGPEIKDLETASEYVKVFLNETGVCNVGSLDVDENTIRLKVVNSVFAEAVGKSKKPVCIPLSGALEGLFEELTGKKWKCKETECSAQDRDICAFEIVRE